MGNSMKKSIPVARQQVARELTPEQKQEAMVRFFSQKRESFSTGILFNMCQSFGADRIPTDAESHALVDRAVSMADRLIEKLYPLKEESEPIKGE